MLRRVTGYRLQRADAHQSLTATALAMQRQRDAAQRQRARLQARLERTRTRLQQTQAALAESQRLLGEAEMEVKAARHRQRSGRSRGVPAHYDESAAEILRRVKPRTMTDFSKLFGLVEATRYVVRRGIPGDIVECGVWRGGSMQAVALTLIEQGETERALHLFDTFAGMPPPTDKDRRQEATAEELLARHGRSHRIWAVAGLDDVQEAMREVSYPADLVHFHEGLVEETVPRDAPAQIALLRLDTDWYESTRHELEHLYERLSPGGILIIDDYGDWEGARLATDEFLAGLGEPLLTLPLGSGRLAVKPGT